ncbi:carbohydrate ABC transporter permease [Nonomuraea sp. NPDC050556]|uniref:carbohydrate ABC transporter permease n=1 Tax=Nonomuraea sp. NPDC050556 TaxID=3364369 RepID=UPI0037B83DDF
MSVPALTRDRRALPRPAARGTRPRRRRTDWRKVGAFVLLTGPMVIGLGIFKYLAIGWSFLLSFNKARGTLTPGHWVGFDNYTFLLQDEAFRSSLTTIAGFTLFIVPVTFVLALALAVGVNSVMRGKAYFRTAFLLPAAVSYVAAALIWKMCLFNGLPSGVANAIGALLGMEVQPWLSGTDPPLYWIVIVTLRLWLQLGLYMVLFLAGLQSIPPHLYEAAALDGAGRRQTFRHITFPLLRPTSAAILMLILINAFQAFDEFFNLFNTGQAGNASAPVRPPLVYLYDSALGDQNYGVGSAGAFILTAIIVAVTLLQGRVVGFGRRN